MAIDPPIFLDSFDHYDTYSQKVYSAGAANSHIDLTGTKSRTGPGCVIIDSGAFGPERVMPAILTHVIYGHAVYVNNGQLGGAIMSWSQAHPLPVIGEPNITIGIETNGAIRVTSFHPTVTVMADSAPNLIAVDVYNYIEVEIVFAVVAGSVKVWLNNALVINAVGQTNSLSNPTPGSDTFRLMGKGGGGAYRHDDLYVIYDTVAFPTRLQPQRVYALLPNADSTPLDWTPSAGVTHFDLVNEVPPDNGTTYVEGSAVAQVDQYLYDTAAVPTGGTIAAIQHSVDSALDAAGAATVGSDVNGTVGGSRALGDTTFVMMVQPYQVDPADGDDWTLAKLAAMKAGPAFVA